MSGSRLRLIPLIAIGDGIKCPDYCRLWGWLLLLCGIGEAIAAECGIGGIMCLVILWQSDFGAIEKARSAFGGRSIAPKFLSSNRFQTEV
jgi:hypothetical protein